ncbi:MAG: hypothetical protein HY914_05040 [Desulfomonile tiedjei]|nr:hypothetical protein [Desulfomonile tiedjei]
MTVATDPKRAKIPLKQFLTDYQSGLGDREIMQKYGLAASHFVSLIKALLQKQVLKPEDLARRKELMAQQEQVKETQFLKSLYICPNCGHPHPEQFDVCPACGFKPAEEPAQNHGVASVTTTGGHFYVEDEDEAAGEEVEEDEEQRADLKTEPLEPPVPKSTTEESSEDTTEPIEPHEAKPEPTDATDRQTERPRLPPIAPKDEPKDKPAPPKDEPTEKASPFKSVRSLIARIRKP